MNGNELRALRERQGWSQEALGELLKASLGRGSATTVGKWETGRRPVPEEVSGFLGRLELEQAYPSGGEPFEPLESEPSSSRGGTGDTAPPPPAEPAGGADGGPPVGQHPLPGGSPYARVCEELWELVATGIGMVGAVTGSEALRRDSEIIAADRQALGKAYGKLAETNGTFRRMLVGMTSGGAWTEVALVTGITFSKCHRSHREIAERLEIERQAAMQEEYGSAEFEPVAAA